MVSMQLPSWKASESILTCSHMAPGLGSGHLSSNLFVITLWLRDISSEFENLKHYRPSSESAEAVRFSIPTHN